jgi:uncharacterized coiled-coil DUF342 family protein
MYSIKKKNESKEQQSLEEKLEEIREYLQQEMVLNQTFVERLEKEIDEARLQILDKDETICRLQAQLQECRQANEGTRQLINKLLNDISNYQKDISWYKRTFEERSLLGIVKDKFFRKKSAADK